MGWTTPTIRSTGFLVSASVWNTDVINNLLALEGAAWVIIGSGGAPAFGTNWSASGAPDAVPAYRLVGGNEVRLRGRFTGTAAANSTAFILPVGFRPLANIWPACMGGGGGSVVHILSTGEVQPVASAANQPAVDGVSFYID